MPNIAIQEVAADQPITGVAEGISVVLVYANRGPVNEPILVTSLGQFVQWFGYYKTDSYSNYSVRGYFSNGGRSLWVIRLPADDTRDAGGADDNKIETLKPQLIHGAGAAEMNIQSVVRGNTGALTSLTIVANATDVTTATLTNTYDITLKLASISAWKKVANVCEHVLNGKAHFVLGGVGATNCFCAYADTAGAGGDNLEIEIIDSGGAGPATYVYNAAGTKIVIDLVGVAVTSGAAIIGINALAGAILANAVGDGLGNIAVVPSTNLASGSAGIAGLTLCDTPGTGLTAPAALTKTWLSGTGVVTAASNAFTDTTGLTALALITSKAIPGDKLIIHNGANTGCYEIETVTGPQDITVTENFAATQTNCIYTIMGTSGAYGHISADTDSPGISGDSITVKIEQELGGESLKCEVCVLDGDEMVRSLEVFEELSPVSTDAAYIDTVLAAESDWVTLESLPENIRCSGAAASVLINDPTITDAAATFVDDEVSVGDLVIVSASGVAANLGVYEVEVVTDNTHIKMTENFPATDAGGITFEVVGDDGNGLAYLNLVGTSGITLTLAGGVDDIPDKADYMGDETIRTGVFAIDKIPVVARPAKLWCPDAPIVVDSTGVDATDLVNVAMGNYCLSRQFLRYTFMNERGLTPAQAIAATTTDNVNNKHTGEYYNWGKMNDPLSGKLKLCPLVGHMNGQAVAVAAGAEGDHAAVANIIIRDVEKLEYDVSDGEAELLNAANINCIRQWNGIRNMGDRMRTTDSAWKWMHKRDVAIRLNQSMLNSLGKWVNFIVNVPDSLGKISKTLDAYLRKEDRRFESDGALLNTKNPADPPYYAICDMTNTDLAGTKAYVDIGYCIVNTIEDVELRVGLWDGGMSAVEK